MGKGGKIWGDGEAPWNGFVGDKGVSAVRFVVMGAMV